MHNNLCKQQDSRSAFHWNSLLSIAFLDLKFSQLQHLGSSPAKFPEHLSFEIVTQFLLLSDGFIINNFNVKLRS